LPSAEQCVTTFGGSTNFGEIQLTPVQGATGYNIYGRSAGAELRMNTSPFSGIGPFYDLGNMTPSGARPTKDATSFGLKMTANKASAGTTHAACFDDQGSLVICP
jgi:hypothetical protein